MLTFHAWNSLKASCSLEARVHNIEELVESWSRCCTDAPEEARALLVQIRNELRLMQDVSEIATLDLENLLEVELFATTLATGMADRAF